METITSRKNPLCVHLRRLAADGKYRRQEGAFLCDGPKLLEEALKWAPERLRSVVCTDPASLPPLPEWVRLVQAPGDVLASLSPSQTPQGVVAECAVWQPELPETLPGRRYVVLDGVQDPGNVGTILRTADAFWADGLFLLEGCADLYHPRTVRASMGAVLRCPVWRCGTEELAALLRRSGIPLYGAALARSTLDPRKLTDSRLALAIGSEGRGLSPEILALCAGAVRLPMNSRCESLNAAAASAALLWELARRDDRAEQ